MELLDMDTLAKGMHGFGHPVRIRCLVLLESERSPAELAELINAPLGVTAYHVRMLRDYGLVHQTKTEPRRGALQHWYARTDLATTLMDTLGPLLGLPRRDGRHSNGTRTAELLGALR